MREREKKLLMNLSPYKLTLAAIFAVIILSSTIVFILGGPTNAAPYLTFIGSVAIPTLLALFKMEQNTVVQNERHEENQDKLATLAKELKAK